MTSHNQPCLKIGHYILGKTLGNGAFGKVKIAKHVYTKEKVAVKILNREKIKNLHVIGKVRREIENLKLFKHPHIIKLIQVICTPSDIFMIMEYVSGGELFQYILKHGKLKESEARRFFQQIISGVDYCHRHKVVHRDLKPENLLLDHDLNVKIADFGLSNMMVDGEFLKTSCGSPNYAAPEIIAGKLYAGPEVDIWSCGVILYALVCGTLPFDDEHIPTLYKKIIAGLFEIPDDLNTNLVNLIHHMLQTDPIKRATIEDIKKYEWFEIDLPDYLFPTALDWDASKIDVETVREVCEKFGVTDHEVCSALNSNDVNDHLAIGYHIITDNKRMEIEARNVKLMDTQNQSIGSGKNVEHVSALDQHYSDVHDLTKKLKRMAMTKDHVNLKREHWHLGIRSQSKPMDIMNKVFIAMKKLNFEWKIINHYHVLARVKNTISNNQYSEISLQLYQLDRRIYLLDFKMLPRADGNENNEAPAVRCQIMEFFEMCASLIKTLVQ